MQISLTLTEGPRAFVYLNLHMYSLKLMPKHSQFLYRTHFNSRQDGIWTMDSVQLLLGPAAGCYLLLSFRLVPVCLFRPATARTSRFATAGKCFVDLQQQEWVSFNQPIRIAIIRTQRKKCQNASFWSELASCSLLSNSSTSQHSSRCYMLKMYSDCTISANKVYFVTQGWENWVKQRIRSTVRCSVLGSQYCQVSSFCNQNTCRWVPHQYGSEKQTSAALCSTQMSPFLYMGIHSCK